MNGHHRLEEFAPPRFPIDDEVIIYTWRNASLLELSNLVRGVLSGSQATDPSLKFSFNLLYPNPHRAGAFISNHLGWAFEALASERASQLQNSSERTLESFRFVPGDIIDVAIYTNSAMIPRGRA
jgi:histone deacetylase complex subunit SAP18